MRLIKSEEYTLITGGKKSLAYPAAAIGAVVGMISGGAGSAVGHAAKFGIITWIAEAVLRKKKKKQASEPTL